MVGRDRKMADEVIETEGRNSKGAKFALWPLIFFFFSNTNHNNQHRRCVGGALAPHLRLATTKSASGSCGRLLRAPTPHCGQSPLAACYPLPTADRHWWLQEVPTHQCLHWCQQLRAVPTHCSPPGCFPSLGRHQLFMIIKFTKALA